MKLFKSPYTFIFSLLLLSTACENKSSLLDNSIIEVEKEVEIDENYERSYWVDIDVKHNNGRGYWFNTADRVENNAPTEQEINNSAKALAQTYYGNKLYVTYHRQFEIATAKTVLSYWKTYGDQYGLEIVPTVVLETYANSANMNFTDAELTEFASWCKTNINSNEFGIYDVYIRHQEGSIQDLQMAVMHEAVGDKLIRVGLQPGEKINQYISGGVEDTWTAECQGITNELWENPVTVNGTNKYGKLLLQEWIMERINGENKRIVWNKIPVAWDYDKPVDSLGYICPGDDALINDPPLKGRIELCDKYIAQWYKENNALDRFYGYSSDLHILEANSWGKPERPSFYEQLRKNEPYKGYFADAMLEIASVYEKYK